VRARNLGKESDESERRSEPASGGEPRVGQRDQEGQKGGHERASDGKGAHAVDCCHPAAGREGIRNECEECW
jgi:hypothetical protein